MAASATVGAGRRRELERVRGDGAAGERQRDVPGGAVERHVERVAAFGELETQRRLAARRAVDRDDRARRRRFDRQRRGRRRARRRCCASTAADRRRGPAAARRGARRPSTAAWCASRSAPAARESARRGRPGPETGPEPMRPARRTDAAVDGPEAGTRGPKASGGGAREIGAGSGAASVTTGCGPRDGTRENGAGGPAGPAAARRAIGTGWVSPWGSGARRSRPIPRRCGRSASISRVTPAGSVSSIGWRGPKAGWRPRRAMQRRDRHRRRVSDRCRERRRDEDPRAHAGVRVFLRRRRVRGRRHERGRAVRLGVRPAGRGMTTVRSSGADGGRGAARAPEWRRHRRQRRLDRQRLDQLGLGQVLIARHRQQAGLAGGIVDGLGRDVRRRRGRRRERPALGGWRRRAGRRRELHRLDDGVPGRLELEHFPVVELVLDRRPDQRRRGVVVGRDRGVVRVRRRGSSADAEAPGAAGSAFTGRPAGSASGEGVFRIAARVFTLIPSCSSVKACRRPAATVRLALCTTDTRFNVRDPAFEQRGGRFRADFCAPKRKKRPAQAYAGSGRWSFGHHRRRPSCPTSPSASEQQRGPRGGPRRV